MDHSTLYFNLFIRVLKNACLYLLDYFDIFYANTFLNVCRNNASNSNSKSSTYVLKNNIFYLMLNLSNIQALICKEALMHE